MASAGRPSGTRLPVLLRRTDQACCVGLVLCALAAMMVSWVYQGGLRGRFIDIDRAAPWEVPFQLDANRADWPEWSMLPGIGERLAKRIVESRQREGPFRRPEDLLRVRGIGPRTLERMRPHLLPMVEES